MKIAIIGYSGSGKSTLARCLADEYQLPVLHFDTVQFRPNWEIRPQQSKEVMTKAFMDLHHEWVIDGNYSKLSFERRMEEADVISPVLSVNCQYRQMTRYGETVTITPVLSSYNGIKYVVKYEIRNKETGALNATGETSHCFLTKDGKIVSLKKVLPETHAVLMGLVEKDEA